MPNPSFTGWHPDTTAKEVTMYMITYVSGLKERPDPYSFTPEVRDLLKFVLHPEPHPKGWQFLDLRGGFRPKEVVEETLRFFAEHAEDFKLAISSEGYYIDVATVAGRMYSLTAYGTWHGKPTVAKMYHDKYLTPRFVVFTPSYQPRHGGHTSKLRSLIDPNFQPPQYSRTHLSLWNHGGEGWRPAT